MSYRKSAVTLAFVVISSFFLHPSSFAQTTTITVDAAAARHPINPQIYGFSYGPVDGLADLNCVLNRYGGNNASRYNWQINADNRASDFYFESVPDNSSVAGERGDSFFAQNRSVGAQTMMTIPTVGWVAKLGAGRNKLSSFSISKYGPQTGNDSNFFPDAGNGILQSTGLNVTGNDPNDANVPADQNFQLGWVNHLVGTWGKASNGGLSYYVLDNEPSIWHATHRDVHPTGATMGEVRDKIAAYAQMIKSVDPSALVVGPEEWGWSGYFFSGYDQQYGSLHGWNSLPDRNNNGGADYLPWLLDQLRQKSAAAGTRLLDVFSVHYYPQSGEYQGDTSQTMQLLRNRSTRSLWDPNYVDESWINDRVQLIPRIKQWVNTYYPGTKTAITEYNWGAENHINGATTQADILGIFGREGLDMAARWTMPGSTTPTYNAFKMYRNYDGRLSGFGTTSVSTTVPNPDNLSAFSAIRDSDGALTIMVINKVLSGTTPITVSLANFQAGANAQTWQLTAANTITRIADTTVTAGALSATLPAQSITLFVVPATSNSMAYQINCGGGAVGSFAADNFFVGGTAWSTTHPMDISGPTNPAPASAYQTVRYDPSQFSYVFPGLTAGGSYKVRLHMVEPVSSALGTRPMNIDINGERVLSSFDPAIAAGGSFRAVIPEFTVPADANGKISITFTRLNGDVPCVAAIEVLSSAPQAPGTPTGVTATAGNAQVTVSWNAVSGATSYNLYRSTTAGGEGTTPVKTGITSATYTDTGLTNGTTYYYKVSAVNAIGESVLSSEVSATPSGGGGGGSAIYQINCGGSAIGSFSADSFFVGGVAWSTSQTMDTSGATNPAPASAYQTVRYDPSQFSYVFPGLTVGSSYKVRLHMVEPVSGSLGTRPMNININGVRVLTGFDPAIAAGGSFKAVIPEFSVPADSAGKISITFIRTNGDVPCVAAIEILSSTPQAPGTPTGVTATAGNAQVALTWNSASGATSYNLYRSTSAGGEGSTPYKTGITSTSYTDTGLTNGTTYFYKVSAVNSVGESGLSAEVSATPSGGGSGTAVYQINCGGGAVGSFAADSFFSGGVAWSTTAQMDTSGATNPAPVAAYQTVRYDPSQFSYTFPNLTAGIAYKVRLHMVEPVSSSLGTRPMNIDINGTRVLTGFDPAIAAGGGFRAVIPEFTVPADSAGKIKITFIRTNGDVPCVAAIEVLN